jgi:O-antigen ligase
MSVPMDAMTARSPLPWNEWAYQKVLSAALAALGFFLLFSTAGVNVAMGVLLALCLAAPARIWRTQPWREPVLAAGLVLLAYIVLRTLLGEGWTSSSLHAINKYQELLMIPLLWALLRNARRPQAFANGLIAGSLLFALMYWVGLALQLPKSEPAGQWLHLHRISAGFVLAVCAFMLFEHARLGKLPRVAGYVAAAFLMATVLFAIDGRTGHLVMVVLLLCAALRAARRRTRLPAVLLALIAAVILGALSNPVRQRVVETLQDSKAVRQGQVLAESSTGARLETLRSALSVARENWQLGTGWQHFDDAMGEAAHRRHVDPTQVLGAQSRNPHNEYLMQLGAGGVPALLLFALWLALPVWRAVRDADTGKPWAGAVGCVALAFAVGSLFNSLLLDFVEAHFYAALMAWLLVRRVED